MKTKRIIRATKNTLLGILTIMILISFASCAKKITFLRSEVTPAAEGNVKVTSDKNNNYVIQVNISNLAEIDRLKPSKKTYSVWMVTDTDETKNIGRISSSSKLNASLETVTSFKPVKIFITAEEDVDAQYPGRTIVLSTDNF